MDIVSTVPQNDSTNIGLTTAVEIVFDEPIDEASIDDASIVVSAAGDDIYVMNSTGVAIPTSELITNDILRGGFKTIIDGTVYIDENDDHKLIFKPKFFYETSTSYRTIVSNTISSTAGNLLPAIYGFSFTTTSQEEVLETPTNDSTVYIDEPYIMRSDPTSPDTFDNFELLYSDPEDGEIFADMTSFIFAFTRNIDESSVASSVTISYVPILEDIATSVPYLYSVTDNVITITPAWADGVAPTNSIIDIRIKQTLLDTDSNILPEPVRVMFATSINPYYGSISMTRFLAGSLIADVSNMTLATGLYYNSVNADKALKGAYISDVGSVKERYAVIATLKNVLFNSATVADQQKVFKRLGEFSISIDNGTSASLASRLMNDIEEQFQAIKNYLSLAKAGGVVRGINHTGYPDTIGRLWDGASHGLQVPGTHKERPTGTLRSRWS